MRSTPPADPVESWRGPPNGIDPGLGLNAVLLDGDGPAVPVTPVGLVGWVLGRQRRRVVVGASAGIVWMGAIALLPVVLGGAIDGAVDGGDGPDVGRWCALLAAVVVAEAAAGIVRHRTAMLLYIRTRWLVERLLTRRVLDPRGGVDSEAGALLSRAQNDAQAIGGISDLMCRGAGAVVTFLAVGIGMLLTSPTLGVVVLVGLPPCLLVLAPLWRPYDRRATEQQARMADATSVAADSLMGLRVVKGLGGERTVRAWFASSSDALQASAVSLARLGSAWTALSAVIPGVFLAVVLWVGGRQVIDGRLGPGELVTFTGLAVFLAIPLSTFAEVGDVWASGIAGARRIAAVLNAAPAVDDGGAEERPPVGGIVLDGVSHGCLDRIDLVVADGEIVGVACRDSTAATALADLLARRIDPAHGVVAVGGVDVRSISLQVLRAHLVVADGHRPWLAEGTLGDNVSLGAAHVDEQRLIDALLVAAGDELAARSGGMRELVGEAGSTLSGGQRQRVAVARAVATDAAVIVFDDPTSALDTVTEARLAQRLVAARAGRSTVILTVSPTVLAVCDRVVLVAEGRAAATGSHAELMETVPAYRELVAPEIDA